MRHSKMTFRQKQIDWLVISSSILNKLASIIEADPDVLLKSTAGRRMSKRVQEREKDRLVGSIKRLAEKGMVLLSAVCSILVKYKRSLLRYIVKGNLETGSWRGQRRLKCNLSTLVHIAIQSTNLLPSTIYPLKSFESHSSICLKSLARILLFQVWHVGPGE
jgi:hypothetical protein